MKISVLGSGSRGNCVLVEGGGVRLLVDAGLSARETRRRLAAVGLEDAALDAVLITHEHTDHVSHAARVARAFEVPVYLNAATRDAAARHLEGIDAFVEFRTGRPFEVGGLRVDPVAKPHDAADAVAFLLSEDAVTAGVFTDLGHVDDRVAAAMGRCHAMVLEANHDPASLAAGSYPPALKRRVGGRLGHLSNEDAARALARAGSDDLGLLVLAHLSQQNNRPELARDAFIRFGGRRPGFPRWISRQDRPTQRFEVRAAAGAAAG